MQIASEQLKEFNEDKIIKLKEVQNIVKLGKTSIYNKIKEGTFPAPVRLSKRSVGFKLSHINEWLNNLETTVEQ